MADTRDPQCVAEWPECEEGAYDPRCCRFPKSCSCELTETRLRARAAIDQAWDAYFGGDWDGVEKHSPAPAPAGTQEETSQ